MNSIDRVPQIPQDYANHIVYGGLLGLACLPFMRPEVACLMVLLVAMAKKADDYFAEKETPLMCVGKTLATAAIPATLLLVKNFHLLA